MTSHLRSSSTDLRDPKDRQLLRHPLRDKAGLWARLVAQGHRRRPGLPDERLRADAAERAGLA